MFCTVCGAPLTVGAAFCTGCGSVITEQRRGRVRASALPERASAARGPGLRRGPWVLSSLAVVALVAVAAGVWLAGAGARQSVSAGGGPARAQAAGAVAPTSSPTPPTSGTELRLGFSGSGGAPGAFDTGVRLLRERFSGDPGATVAIDTQDIIVRTSITDAAELLLLTETGGLAFRPVLDSAASTGPPASPPHLPGPSGSTQTVGPEGGGTTGMVSRQPGEVLSGDLATDGNFAALDCSASDNSDVDGGSAPDKAIVACGQDGKTKYWLDVARVAGADVAGADVVKSGIGGGQQVINIHFTGAGQVTWTDLTAANVGRQIAVVLGGSVLSSPIIEERISGDAQITGAFTPDHARHLAEVMASGALPAGLGLSTSTPIPPVAVDPENALQTLAAAGQANCLKVLAPEGGCGGTPAARISRIDGHFGFSGPDVEGYHGAVFERSDLQSAAWTAVLPRGAAGYCTGPEGGASVPVLVELGQCLPAPSEAATATAGPSQSYSNPRYGFTCQIPADYAAGSPPDNGDGQSFTSPDGTVRVLCYGSNASVSPSAASAFDSDVASAIADGSRVTYKHLSGPTYTISGFSRSGEIFYTRTVWGMGSVDTLSWTYPQAKQSEVQADLERSASGFSPGDVSIGH